MKELERGAIANPDEGRMVGHYWLRNAKLAPTPFLQVQIDKTLAAVCDFADSVISGVCFLPIKRSGVVGKLSFASAVADSTSSIPEDKKISKNPIIVIDNYDSFTYNLCQAGVSGRGSHLLALVE